VSVALVCFIFGIKLKLLKNDISFLIFLFILIYILVYYINSLLYFY
jgi:hypothetical protein